MYKILGIIFLISVVFITTGAGYMGTLPDIDSEFSYLKKETTEKSSAPFSIQELDKQNEQQLKPIPRDDENYVDIIIKKDKTTKYINDTNSVIIILEKLRVCLNTNQDIQKFNAIVSNLIDNIDYIEREYRDKPESNYLSYSRLINLSLEARETANFRMKALNSQNYIPYTSKNNIYTKEAIETKLESLLNNVSDTIFVLKNLE